MTTNIMTIGALKGPHGLQGWVKANLKLEDPAFILDLEGLMVGETPIEVLNIKAVGQGLFALQIKSISTPEAAAALRGLITIPRANMPVDEDEVLLADLIGQPLFGPDAAPVGTIQAVQELPAGPALVVELPLAEGTTKPKTVLIPVEEDFVELEAAPTKATLTEFGLSLLTL